LYAVDLYARVALVKAGRPSPLVGQDVPLLNGLIQRAFILQIVMHKAHAHLLAFFERGGTGDLYVEKVRVACLALGD
jgi:hypothetical protein